MIATNKKILLPLLIFVISLFPRGVEVVNMNPVFGFDQGREYLMTRDIVEKGDHRLIGTALGAGSAGLQGIFHGPAYYYLLAIPYIFADGDPNAGVVLMFLFGALSLILGFIFGQKLFGFTGGVILMMLIGISPPFISQSRFIWSPYPSTFFILLSLYYMFQIKAGKKYIFLTSFFSAFIYNFEFAIAVPMSVGFIFAMIFIFKFRQIKEYAYSFLGFIFGFLPMIVFEIRNNFLALNGFISYLFTDKPKTSSDLDRIFFIDHLNAFLISFKDAFQNFGISYIVLLVLLFISLVYLLKREKDKFLQKYLLYLSVLPIINFVILMPLKNAVYSYYLYHIMIIYFIFFTYVFLNKGINILTKLILSIILLSMIINFFYVNTKMIIYDYQDYGGTAKFKGKVDAIDFIYKEAKGEPFNLLVFSPPIYTYAYDYLIDWYGRKKYGYIPGGEKKGEFYLLIEVDPAKPWTYKGWLETVIKDGEVVYTKKLPSGFIVQKRTK